MAVMLSKTMLVAENLSEHDLIEATRDGDDRAFEELYARYRGPITAYIHGRVRDSGRAEDVGQEVFISALRRLRTGTQEIHFKPWIYEIARNACIDEFRRGQRGREVPLDADADAAATGPLLSLAPSPPAVAETNQRMSDLRGAFGGLSDSHHQLIVLREFEGLSYDDIAARTGMSRQMVESALFRARRKLTEEYEELSSGRRCREIQSAIDAGRAFSARALGIRERRQFARHLSHCQACRMHAHFAGVDEALVSRKRIGAKIAALLPFPLWRWSWDLGRSRSTVAQVGAHPAALQTLQSVSEPAAAATSLGGAAVAAVVLALAGAGAATAPAATHRAHPVIPRHLAAAPMIELPAASVTSHVNGGAPAPSRRAPRSSTVLRIAGPGARWPAARSRHTPARRSGRGPAGADAAPTSSPGGAAGATSGTGRPLGPVTPQPETGVPARVVGHASFTLEGATGAVKHAVGALRVGSSSPGAARALGPVSRTAGSTVASTLAAAGSASQDAGTTAQHAADAAAGLADPAVGSADAAAGSVDAVGTLIGSLLRRATGL